MRGLIDKQSFLGGNRYDLLEFANPVIVNPVFASPVIVVVANPVITKPVVASLVVANLVVANLVVAVRVVTNPGIANSTSQTFCESGNPREFT